MAETKQYKHMENYIRERLNKGYNGKSLIEVDAFVGLDEKLDDGERYRVYVDLTMPLIEWYMQKGDGHWYLGDSPEPMSFSGYSLQECYAKADAFLEDIAAQGIELR